MLAHKRLENKPMNATTENNDFDSHFFILFFLPDALTRSPEGSNSLNLL